VWDWTKEESQKACKPSVLARWTSNEKLSLSIGSDFLEKAVAIDGIQLTPRGYRARNLYALSRAQAALPGIGNAVLAATTENAAIKLAGKISLKADGDNWEAFDLLIRIVER